ncbi:MAG: O-antigen ligase family protein [Ignavibacteriae bacterium]|nr:hypothetical protein [Ignavibacteriota bacterium]NOG98220.1 O-antigen ligase family protein [Ignavibacteriota bacterium]
MFKTISTQNIILIGIAVTIAFVIFIDNLIILSGIAFSVLVWLIINKESVPAVLLAFLLTLVSDINETLRLIVNALIIILLSYYFIKKYGFDLKSIPKLPQPILTFILFIIASTFLSSLFSTNKSIGLYFLTKEVIFFFLVYLFFSFIENENNIRYYIYALIFPAIIVSVSVIYSFFTTDMLLFMFQTLGFASSTAYIGNIASVGGLLTITIALTFYLIIINNQGKRRNVNILYLILILQILGLILTNSRAAYLGSFVSFAFVILSYFNDKRKLIIISSVLVIAIILVSNPKLVDAFLLLIRAERVFENPRYNLWDISFNIIKDNTLFGSGPGNFSAYMYKYNPTMLNSFAGRDVKFIHDFAAVGHSHNFFLFKFSEMGLLGLVNALLLPYFFFLYAFRIKNSIASSDNKNYWLIITIIGCGLGMFTRSIFESTGLMSYGWITRDLPFWILFSIVIYLYKVKYLANENV